MPSKAVLVIGALGMVWLILAGLLLVHVDEDLDSSGTQFFDRFAEALPVEVVSDAAASANDATVLVRYSNADPQGDLAGTGDSSAHPSTSDAGIDTELRGLLRSIADDLANPSPTFDTESDAYMSDLVQRINQVGHTFVVRFDAPVVADARRRAVRAHAALVDRGLQPWLVEASGGAGPYDVAVHRID